MTVPAGTSATVVLPDGTTDDVGPGTHHRPWRTFTSANKE